MIENAGKEEGAIYIRCLRKSHQSKESQVTSHTTLLKSNLTRGMSRSGVHTGSTREEEKGGKCARRVGKRESSRK